jgi:hypothetical protein
MFWKKLTHLLFQPNLNQISFICGLLYQIIFLSNFMLLELSRKVGILVVTQYGLVAGYCLHIQPRRWRQYVCLTHWNPQPSISSLLWETQMTCEWEYWKSIHFVQHVIAAASFGHGALSSPLLTRVMSSADHEHPENQFRNWVHVRMLLMETYWA